MITSRDINSCKEVETQHMFIDVIERYREQFNNIWAKQGRYDNGFEVEIPYPEEFVRSPNRKFVRVVSTRFIIQKPVYAEEWDAEQQAYTRTANLETPMQEYTLMTRKDYPADNDASNDFLEADEKLVPIYVALAGSFVQDTNNDEQIVCIMNAKAPNYIRTYEQHTTQKSLKVWIYDMLERVKMNLAMLASQYCSVLLELELVY